MEKRSTDHLARLLRGLLLFAFWLSCGCSAPLVSAPKKKQGPNSFEKTWTTLFGSVNDFKESPDSKTRKPDSTAFEEDYDFSQLSEKPQGSQKSSTEQNSQQQNHPASEKVTLKKTQSPQEPTAVDAATAAQMKKLREIFSQDSWSTNVELQTWLDKQAEAGEIPDVHSLVARPNDPTQKKKTNFYAQLNTPAGSKIRPSNFVHRSAEAAAEGPISLNRWYHASLEEVLLNMGSLEPEDAKQLKLLVAKVLAESPERSIIETNSAIFLARLGVEETKPFLSEAIQNNDLSPKLRAASAEAFAQLDTTENDELLHLIAKFEGRLEARGLRHETSAAAPLTNREPFESIESAENIGFANAVESPTESLKPQASSLQPQLHPGVPILLIDLLQSLAQRIPPADAECFTTALQSRTAAVRLAAVRIWRDTPASNDGRTCPDEILKLATDPIDERIRIAALTAVARWNHPQAMRHILDGVNDTKISVRLAAFDALGIIGGSDAIKCLNEHSRNSSPKIRSRIAAALRNLNEKETLYRFAEDKASEVRNEVAKGLDDPTVYNTDKLVKTLLNDQSSMVQKSVIESIRNWPLELSAAVLFEEMKSTSLLKRETATSVLAEKWPHAATYEFADRRIDIRTKSLADLMEHYYSQQTGIKPLSTELHRQAVALFDADDDLSNENSSEEFLSDNQTNPVRQVSWTNPDPNPRAIDRISLNKGRDAFTRYFDANATREERTRAKEQMLSLDEKLTLVVEYLAFNENQWIPDEIYREILPQSDSVFRSINNLDEENVSVRRKAADEIYAHSQRRPFGPLVVSQIYESGARETDAITLITLFKVFESSPGEIADQFAKVFVDNEHPEIRRRACELLGQSENLQVLRELLPMIDDTSPEVVRTALDSLGKLAAVYFADNEENIDLESRYLITNPVRRLLLRPEASLQIAASTTLVRWKDSTGFEAFQRLAGSRDDKTRLAVAQSIGKLDDTALANILILLLDDKRGSVRQAALNALPKLLGKDHGNPDNAVSVPIAERIQRWKSWAKTNIEYNRIENGKIGYNHSKR